MVYVSRPNFAWFILEYFVPFVINEEFGGDPLDKKCSSTELFATNLEKIFGKSSSRNCARDMFVVQCRV